MGFPPCGAETAPQIVSPTSTARCSGRHMERRQRPLKLGSRRTLMVVDGWMVSMLRLKCWYSTPKAHHVFLFRFPFEIIRSFCHTSHTRVKFSNNVPAKSQACLQYYMPISNTPFALEVFMSRISSAHCKNYLFGTFRQEKDIGTCLISQDPILL